MEAIEKKTNPFVRAGRWIKNIFTRKTVVDTVIIAHKRGQLRAKRRVMKERVKIAYYRTRNVVLRTPSAIKSTYRRTVTTIKDTFNRAIDRVTAMESWPSVRNVLSVIGEGIKGVVSIFVLSAVFIFATTATVEFVVYMSMFMGEALAASTAFVSLYLLAYYGGHWVMQILASRKLDKMLDAVEVPADDEFSEGTSLTLAHA